MWEWFLHNNSAGAKILRTVVEAGLTALITYLPDIIEGIPWTVPDALKVVIITIVPAALSAILNMMGNAVVAAKAKKAARLAQNEISAEE